MRYAPFFAVGNRIAFQWDRLNMPSKVSEGMALKTMKNMGFERADVSLTSLARAQIGTSEYLRGAGMNYAPQCFSGSSFTKWLYGMRGIRIPRNTIQQYRIRSNDRSLKRPSIQYKIDGCLVFTKGPNFNRLVKPNNAQLGHVGIMTAKGTIIHAWPGKGVVEDSLEAHLVQFPLVETLMIHDEKKAKTFIIPPNMEIETTDDLRWLILQNYNMLDEF